LREYGLTACRGDRYGPQWVVQSFAGHGITYTHSARDRSAIYADAVPLFTSGRARLLDNRKLINQLAALERRTSPTRDKIDHPRGARDDCANAAAGALVAAADRTNEAKIVGGWGVFTAPRRGFPGSVGGTAEDAAYSAAMFGIPYGRRGDS